MRVTMRHRSALPDGLEAQLGFGLAVRGSVRHRVLIAVVVSVVPGAFSPAAQARWSEVTRLPHRVDVVAANSRGEQVMLWNVASRKTITGVEEYSGAYVRARSRRADGRLTRPRTLSRKGGVVTAVGVALDRRGTATALMTEQVHSYTRILVSVRGRARPSTPPRR